MASKQFTSLSLNKQKSKTSGQNVFGNDDSDEEAKPQTSAEKFHSKFGNLKARDERAVKKVLDENPDIYDYDGAYDEIQNKRSRVEEEKETKRKEDKKARYTDKLLDAKKKRDLEKLLRDERKQEKERVAEGDEFKGKDVFVTGAYRKQLEETVKFRKELEDSDRIDDMTAVSGQKMWRENFGKKMMEDKLRGRFLDTEEDEEPKEKIKKMDDHEESKERRSHREESKERRSHREESKERRSHREESRERRSHREEHREKRSYREEPREKTKRRSDREAEEPKKKSTKMGYREAEKLVREQRMTKIREILSQRNTPTQIEEARERYLERREKGLIVPPV